MDGQVTPELEVALRQDGGDGLTGAGVEVGGGLRYEGGGFTLEAMARSLVSDGDDAVEYQEWVRICCSSARLAPMVEAVVAGDANLRYAGE